MNSLDFKESNFIFISKIDILPLIRPNKVHWSIKIRFFVNISKRITKHFKQTVFKNK